MKRELNLVGESKKKQKTREIIFEMLLRGPSEFRQPKMKE